jgi:hypothetical protein
MAARSYIPRESNVLDEAAEVCEDRRCNTPDQKVYYCVDCSSRFCETCWTFQTPHQDGKLGRDGQPHEQTNYHVAKRLEKILHPPADEDELRQMHEEDQDSTWFGTSQISVANFDNVLTCIGWSRDTYNHRPILEDHGAYASLMADNAGADAVTKYPQLVSFVGQTSKLSSWPIIDFY